MCMSAPKMSAPAEVPAPPPPPKAPPPPEKTAEPVVRPDAEDNEQKAKRKGRAGLTIPLGGVQTGGSGLGIAQ